MILSHLSRYERPIILGLLPLLLLLLVGVPVRAQTKAEAQITNLKWKTKDDVIVITYDLNESTENNYDVSVILKREGTPDFSVVPLAIEGDIGTGPYAGPNREARWYFRRDIPQGLLGTGYYFEIHVKTVKPHSNLLYYVVGAVAVTGGLVALLVSRGQDTSVPVLELPTPPGRP
jgi:hypothetical protein